MTHTHSRPVGATKGPPTPYGTGPSESRCPATTRRLTAVAALLTTVAALATANRAAVPDQKPEQLRKSASHIVTGKVTAIYTREGKGNDFHDTSGVVEVAVSAVEKGDGVEPGDAVYARFHTRRWVGTGRPPSFGQGHAVPAQDEEVRVYLRRKAGGYDALLPNGFEPLAKKPGVPKAAPQRDAGGSPPA